MLSPRMSACARSCSEERQQTGGRGFRRQCAQMKDSACLSSPKHETSLEEASNADPFWVLATQCLQRRRVSSSPPAWTCPTSHAGGTASDGPCVATGCLAQEKLSHYRTVIVARNKHIDIQVAPAWQIPGIPTRLRGLLVEKKQSPATSWQSAKVLISYIHTPIDTHFLLSTTALIVQERTFHSAIPKVHGTEN